MPARLRISSPDCDLGSAHPACQDRLSEGMCVGLQLLGDTRRIGHALRRHDDQHAVGLRILRRDFQRLGVALRFGIAQNIHRIVVAPCAGQELRCSCSSVSGESSASSPPPRASASVASTPGPPALVTMQRRGPLGRGCLAEHFGHIEELGDGSTRSTPLRRNAASRTSSLPVSEPVCEAAALAAWAVRPALITMIGLVSATSRAAPTGSCADRRSIPCKPRSNVVRGSLPKYVDQIAPAHVQHGADGDERAEADHRCSDQSSTAVQSAPLWLMNARLPGRATVCAKVAFKPSRPDSSRQGSSGRSGASCPGWFP